MKAVYAVAPSSMAELATQAGRRRVRTILDRCLRNEMRHFGVYEVGPRAIRLIDPPEDVAHLFEGRGMAFVYSETPVAPYPSMAEAAR